jgi:tight adherence protein B
MLNPIVMAGCLAVGAASVAFAFLGGESRAQKRRAALGRNGPKAIGAPDQADRVARKKQIADGLRDMEKRSRRRFSLQSRIEQAGLSITPRQYFVGSAVVGLMLAVITDSKRKTCCWPCWSA